MTHTSLQHSNHIISELIEVILKSNELNLKVSEIEGDAVLFYKGGEPPKIEEIIHQSKKMFIEFHAFLKVIDRDNVCQCGACNTVSKLTLKFITHYGELQEVAIQDFHKLVGSDVILAHRLLKNNIPGKEYLLLSERYLEAQNARLPAQEGWITIEPNREVLEEFGEIDMKYITLTPLRKLVPSPPRLEDLVPEVEPISLSVKIQAPMLLVHQVLTDARSRLKWVIGLKDVRNAQPINRIQASHTCVFEDIEIHIVTTRNSVSGDGINFTEREETNVGLNFISDYTFKEENGSTHLSLKVIPENVPQKMIKDIAEAMGKNLESLKKYCEKVFKESHNDKEQR